MANAPGVSTQRRRAGTRASALATSCVGDEIRADDVADSEACDVVGEVGAVPAGLSRRGVPGSPQFLWLDLLTWVTERVNLHEAPSVVCGSIGVVGSGMRSQVVGGLAYSGSLSRRDAHRSCQEKLPPRALTFESAA